VTRRAQANVTSLVLALAAFCSANVALAQSPSEAAAGRTEFSAGVDAAAARQWPVALGHFERAYQLLRRPEILLNVAGAQTQTGRLVAAIESYRTLLDSEGVSVEIRRVAESSVARLGPRIAHVRVSVHPARDLATDESLEIDGVAISRTAIETEWPIDSGTHTVSVRRAGTEVAHERLSLVEGEHRSVQFVLPPRARPRFALGEDGARTSRRASGPTVFASPWFWIATVAVIGAGAATAAYFAIPPAAPQGSIATVMAP
jgi:hypothetical protein